MNACTSSSGIAQSDLPSSSSTYPSSEAITAWTSLAISTPIGRQGAATTAADTETPIYTRNHRSGTRQGKAKPRSGGYRLGVRRRGPVREDQRLAAWPEVAGRRRGILGDQLAERVDLLRAGHDPEQPASPLELRIGEGHPANALVLAGGDRDPAVGDLEHGVAGDEGRGVPVRADPEVGQVDGVRE